MTQLCTTHRNQYGISVWVGWLNIGPAATGLVRSVPMALHVHRTWITNPSIIFTGLYITKQLSAVSLYPVHFNCSFMQAKEKLLIITAVFL